MYPSREQDAGGVCHHHAIAGGSRDTAADTAFWHGVSSNGAMLEAWR